MTHRASIQLESTLLDDTIAIGAKLGEHCVKGDVILLEGELGAGKTQFVRGIAQGMGLDHTHVASPTFVLMREYELPGQDWPLLVHIDAYRLSTADELMDAGYSDELRAQSLTAIEWASRVDGLIDPHDLAAIAVSIRHTQDLVTKEPARLIHITARDSLIAKL